MTRLPTSQPSPQGSSKLIIIALVVALVAAIFNSLYLSMIRQQVQEESIVLYRLLRTKAVGEKLERDDVEPLEVPKRFESSFVGAVNSSAGLATQIGENFTVTVPQNSILDMGHFSDDGKFQIKILPGYRRIDLEINPKRIPSGLAAGRYIDILIPLTDTGGQPKYFTMMENVRVVGVGTQSIEETGPDGGGRRVRNYRTISIEVKPAAAPIIAYLEDIKKGDFRILLRNESDRRLENPDTLTDINKEVIDRLPNHLRPSN